MPRFVQGAPAARNTAIGLRRAAGPGDAARAARRRAHARGQPEHHAQHEAAALTTLAPVLTECDKTLDWISKGWMRNDLALTQYKLGDRAACLQTLAPLAESAGKSDEKIQEEYPPADAEIYLPVVRATRTNLKLCRG